MNYFKKYNLDPDYPIDALSQIDKIISELFQVGCKNNRELIKELNNLLQIHHFLVRKIYFLTKESNTNEIS